MFTCFIKYTIDPKKLDSFEKYAHVWISLVEKYGGIHHGYFLPEKDPNNLPNADFSFSNIGKKGADNIAVALFSFFDVVQYEAYREAVAKDEECKKITDYSNATHCFLSYERSFLKPLSFTLPK